MSGQSRSSTDMFREADSLVVASVQVQVAASAPENLIGPVVRLNGSTDAESSEALTKDFCRDPQLWPEV
jgi:hypothetical protein